MTIEYYHIFRRRKGTEEVTGPLRNESKEIIFTSQQKAADYCRIREMTYPSYVYFFEAADVDTNWQKREQSRFDMGEYVHVPWHKEPWCIKEHYSHVNMSHKEWVSYTSGELSGIRDVHVHIKPFEYLTKFHADLAADVIKGWTRTYRKLYDKGALLQFAHTADEIVKVYKRGPQSCMKDPPLRSSIHPVAAYAGPDLAVAYLSRSSGRAVQARALCWPEKKIYGRLYGQVNELADALREEGFAKGDLTGARLTRIKEGDLYVCPYIDGAKKVRITNKFLYIDPAGKFPATSQDGYCGVMQICHYCHIQHLGPKGFVLDGYHCCAPCFEKLIKGGQYAQCERSLDYFAMKKLVKLATGQFWHSGYINNYDGFRCFTCKEAWPFRPYANAVRSIGYECTVCNRARMEQERLRREAEIERVRREEIERKAQLNLQLEKDGQCTTT